MPTQPTTKSPKTKINKQNKKMPMRISLFWIWTIALPLVVAGLLINYAYTGSFGANVSGPYGGFVSGFVARFVLYCAYASVFIIGLIGVIYAFVKARRDWRYYALSLTLPVLLFGWLLFGMIQQNVHDSSPDYDRYLSNIGKCSDIVVEGTASKYGLPSEQYKNIDTEQVKLKDYDDRVKALYDPTGKVRTSGVCADDLLTEAELTELTIYYSEHRGLQKDLLLLEILDLESQGGRAACDFARSYSKVEEYLPTVATREGDVCKPSWLSWEHGGDYISTLELLQGS